LLATDGKKNWTTNLRRKQQSNNIPKNPPTPTITPKKRSIASSMEISSSPSKVFVFPPSDERLIPSCLQISSLASQYAIIRLK
jgi:hypothetical protein